MKHHFLIDIDMEKARVDLREQIEQRVYAIPGVNQSMALSGVVATELDARDLAAIESARIARNTAEALKASEDFPLPVIEKDFLADVPACRIDDPTCEACQ